MTGVPEKTILVVDDEPDIRQFLATCIEDAGFNVVTACDGEDALEKIEQCQPDLMTLDMVMPRKSGIELLRELRNSEKWSDLPVIVITAHARDELGSDDIKSFNAFASRMRPKVTMEKPVTPPRLIKAIREILGVAPSDMASESETELKRAELIKAIHGSSEETLDRLRQALSA